MREGGAGPAPAPRSPGAARRGAARRDAERRGAGGGGGGRRGAGRCDVQDVVQGEPGAGERGGGMRVWPPEFCSPWTAAREMLRHVLGFRELFSIYLFFFFLGETGVFEGGRKENGSVLPGLWGALGVLRWQPMEPVLSTADTPERTRGWCCINGEPP